GPTMIATLAGDAAATGAARPRLPANVATAVRTTRARRTGSPRARFRSTASMAPPAFAAQADGARGHRSGAGGLQWGSLGAGRRLRTAEERLRDDVRP